MTKQLPLKVQRDSEIAVLTFNRPEVYNALDTETVTLASALMDELLDDPEIKVIVVTGAGKAFIAGADIAEMRHKAPAQARVYSELGHALMCSIEQSSKPIIAAINGYCLGGGMEVALASDIRVASEKARFGLPETILGIIPGWGALTRSTRLFGVAVTKELIFTGDIINSRRALEIGMINHVVPHNELISFVLDMAKKICRQSQFAIARAKEVVDASLDKSLSDACALETDAFVACFEAGDQIEGMQAFLEKREPIFDRRG
jgi:enoyl-CoA hydratase